MEQRQKFYKDYYENNKVEWAKRNKEYYTNNTEYFKEHARNYVKNLTGERREKYLERVRSNSKKIYWSMTSEERKAHNKRKYQRQLELKAMAG